ncbi:MAG: hypothetical protein JSR58_04960 [Verrucomicrobia bacterium]|nr:hypothetical protein [Verrucomicrobiota bacterium]
MKNLKVMSSMAVLAALVAGCASYDASPLSSLSGDAIMQKASSNNEVVAVAKAFDKSDCKRYLDRDVIREGYQPVQLYIENPSEKNYVFALSRVGLPLARSEEVAERVHTSTVGRAVGYGVGGLFLWPLLIPAVVDGIKSSDANQQLDRDFMAKTAKDQVLTARSHMNTIVFVPREAYQSKFSITLIEEGSLQPKVIEVQAN